MIKNAAEYIKPLTAHRRALHMIPEASFKEEKTAQYICDVLDMLKVPYKRLLPTGIVAQVNAKHNARTLAFRADIDALPVEENTGRSFKSKHPGFMHACGHDAHTATLLTFAQYLSENSNSISYNAALIFQPAEEGYGGSLEMIKAGVLEYTAAHEIYSFHVSPIYPTGRIYISHGPATSCDLAFDIIVRGKTSHAAVPHDGRDTIVAASALVNALQSIVSRENDPTDPLVLTIGTFKAGTKRNVIADEALLECSIRSHSEDIASKAYKSVQRICSGVGYAYNVSIDLNIHHFYAPVINDDVCVKRIKDCFLENEVVQVPPLAVAEDFFAYSKKIPSAMFLCGVKDVTCGFTHPLHSDKFDLNEDALLYALETYIRIIK